MTEIEDLYERYAGDIRRFALYLSGDMAMADEITSDTFVRAWMAFGAHSPADGEKPSFCHCTKRVHRFVAPRVAPQAARRDCARYTDQPADAN
jgi:DNA-directed RNA polymerase specialized sigma24 family protein